MLRKLLKYDFVAILKYWGLAAAGSFLLSIICGLCFIVLDYEKVLPDVLTGTVTILLTIGFFGIMAFSALSNVIVFIRFYKNFFTDEGYLTFTLPVKKSQLLNSKLISGVSMTILSTLILAIDISTIFFVSPFRKQAFKFWEDFFEGFGDIIADSFEELGAVAVIYIIEIIFLILLAVVFSVLLIFSCITFASIVAKKAKIFAAVGFYYLVNNILGIIIAIFLLFGADNMDLLFSNVSDSLYPIVLALVLLVVILLCTIFFLLLYAVQYWMLDRKLNLN